MSDIQIRNNSRGLTYTLADYAKSVNGGKSVKFSLKQWQNIMDVVTEINSKRTKENLIFKGGNNLLGKASENFIPTGDSIIFSQDEANMILKAMGINSPLQDQNNLVVSEKIAIKGLTVEKSENINNEEKNKINKQPISQKNIDNLEKKFKNISQQNEETIVSTAKDTINIKPPFEIRTPKTGYLGGGTRTISQDFHNKVMDMAEKLNCSYEDLITVMNFESGINPKEGNPQKGPVGLIQFTNISLKSLNRKYSYNLTKADVIKMTETEQLDLVEKYLKMSIDRSPRLRNKKKLDAADLYSLILLPNRAGRDILCEKGERNSNGKLLRYYESNAPIDVGNDGIITRADILAKLDEFRINVRVV